MEGGQADAAFGRTISNRLRVVVDNDIRVLHRAGDQRRLDLGIDVALVDIDPDCRETEFMDLFHCRPRQYLR